MATSLRVRARRAPLALLALLLGLVGLLGLPAAKGAHASVSEVRYAYAIELRGDVHTSRDAFAADVAFILADPRGWTLGGAVDFRAVADGEDVTIVLASPAVVDSASPACSGQYSCRVGDEIYINDERWRHGAEDFGSLSTYRRYLINHEMGHYLELDHRGCGGDGLLAPVMMQQSIDTGQCRRNPWPLPEERRALAERLGVEIRTFEGIELDRATGGHWRVTVSGAVGGYEGAPNHGNASQTVLEAPVVDMAGHPGGEGYWLAATDGGVFAYGAPYHGSAGDIALREPIVGMAADLRRDGYWLVATDGGVFSYGAAPFHGSAGDLDLVAPVVGMATDPVHDGYWLAASDGGVFTYGASDFHGSAGNLDLVAPIIGIAAPPGADGYWLVAEDGGIFTFGAAEFHGSLGGRSLDAPVAGMAPAADGRGYWILAANGRAYPFGSAAEASSAGSAGSPGDVT